ncbi:MAG: sigma 54-interacting transcriptional regulator [Treponema sp.]|nr:sigma 54-interacting transcriptional regulator [Treponema sp.]
MSNNSLLQIVLISSRNDVVSFCRKAFSGKVDFLTMQNLSNDVFSRPHFLLLDASLVLNASTQILEKIHANQKSMMILVPSDSNEDLSEYCEGFCPNLVTFPIEQALFALRVTNMLENLSKTSVSVCTDTKPRSDSLLGFFEGTSPATRELRAKIEKAVMLDGSVLLLGETGTGKSTAANVIHQLSKRKEKLFRSINVATLPDNLTCSILFGTEKGAYTDAVKSEGLYKIADGGTMFLDEIGVASPLLQAMLLTFMDTGTFFKMGGTNIEKVDVRSIFATNASIGEMLQNGSFRMDLFFRISDSVIEIPPLRERKEDLRIIAGNYVVKKERVLSEAAFQKLEGYHWPGNIRELHQCLDRAIANCKSETIPAKYLDFGIFNGF